MATLRRLQGSQNSGSCRFWAVSRQGSAHENNLARDCEVSNVGSTHPLEYIDNTGCDDDASLGKTRCDDCEDCTSRESAAEVAEFSSDRDTWEPEATLVGIGWSPTRSARGAYLPPFRSSSANKSSAYPGGNGLEISRSPPLGLLPFSRRVPSIAGWTS